MDGECVLEVEPAELIGRLYMFWVFFVFCAVVPGVNLVSKCLSWTPGSTTSRLCDLEQVTKPLRFNLCLRHILHRGE